MFSEASKGHLSILLFTLLISTSFPLGQYLTAHWPPLLVTWSRFVIAALFFAGLLIVRGELRLPKGAQMLRYAVLSLLTCFYFWSMFEALKQGDPVEIAAIYTLVPIMTALMARLLGQHLRGRQWLMLVAGLLAAVWIIVGGSVERLQNLHIGDGSLIYLWGCIAFAANPILVKSTLQKQPLMLSTFWILLCSALWLTPLLPATLTTGLPGPSSAELIAGLVYMGLMITALSFFLFQYACVRLQSAQVMAYSYLVPVLVMLMSIVAGQAPVWSQLPAVLVILAVVAVMLNSRPEPAAVAA